jgi:alpha-beta hydrolase superfamily lysophospholipase
MGLIGLAAPVASVADAKDSRAQVFDRARADALKPALLPFPSTENSPDMRAYEIHYGLSFPGAVHRWGYAWSAGKRLFVQAFVPERPRGSVLFLHGYMDHSGGYARFFAELLRRGYAVYALDLPGHGLSEGRMADIGDFKEYGLAAAALAGAAASDGADPGTLYAAGHSAGCAAWLVYLSEHDNPFRQILFGAPLVRSSWWKMVKLGVGLAAWTGGSLPHSNGPRTRKDVYPYPFEIDPLNPPSFPLSWAKALIAWNKENPGYGPYAGDLTIIQGEADAVVDWRYNLGYLSQRFPGRVDSVLVEGANHYVFVWTGKPWLEAEGVLDRVFGAPL